MKLIEATTQEDINMLAAFAIQARNEAGGDPTPPDGSSMFWLVQSPEGIIGSVGLYGISWISRRCRGMIYIAPEFRGNGLAVMVHGLIEMKVFDELNLRRLEGVIRDDNAQMIALMESIGAVREGELKDVAFEAGRYRTYLMYRFTKEA